MALLPRNNTMPEDSLDAAVASVAPVVAPAQSGAYTKDQIQNLLNMNGLEYRWVPGETDQYQAFIKGTDLPYTPGTSNPETETGTYSAGPAPGAMIGADGGSWTISPEGEVLGFKEERSLLAQLKPIIAMAATAGAFPSIPGLSAAQSGALINAATTVAGGGSLEDAARGALTSFVGGTVAGQVSGATSDVLGDVGSKIAGNVASAAVTGKDPMQALISGGIGAGIDYAAGDTPGEADFTDANAELAAWNAQNDPLVDSTTDELLAGLSPSVPGDTEAPNPWDEAQKELDKWNAEVGEPSTVLGDLFPDDIPPPTAKQPGLSPSQMMKIGQGLFGAFMAKKGIDMATGRPKGAPAPGGPAFVPYQGNAPQQMQDPAYYQQVQEQYNKMMPQMPKDVATPLEQWYASQQQGRP